MPHRLAALLALALASAAAQDAPPPPAAPPAAEPAPTPHQPDWSRAPAHWNLEVHDGGARLALQGWDPVACFPEGGGQPREGSARFSTVHGGVGYRFASEANLKAFLGDPWKYEPAYGGWCAWAMAKGEKVEVDPASFRILDGRLFVFYDGLFADTRASWLKDEARVLRLADAAWVKLSGERNRGEAARRERSAPPADG